MTSGVHLKHCWRASTTINTGHYSVRCLASISSQSHGHTSSQAQRRGVAQAYYYSASCSDNHDEQRPDVPKPQPYSAPSTRIAKKRRKENLVLIYAKAFLPSTSLTLPKPTPIKHPTPPQQAQPTSPSSPQSPSQRPPQPPSTPSLPASASRLSTPSASSVSTHTTP
jgi:hypothetical protein